MNASSTAREALIKELLGDMDGLLKRAEALPDQILDSESKIKNTVALIDAAGDRYRLAVTAFNEEAKRDLSEFASNKTRSIEQATAISLENHRAALITQQNQSFNTEKIADQISNSISNKLNSSSARAKIDYFFNPFELTKIAIIIIATAIALRILFRFI